MGWRKPTVTVRDEPEALVEAAVRRSAPLEAAKLVWERLGTEDRAAFLEWVRARS